MRGYYVVTQKIKDTLEQDPNVNTVNTGIIQDVLLRKADMYPYSHLIVNNSTYNGSTWSFNLSVICMDIVDLSKDETQEIFLGNDNQQDVLNTQLAVINRMLEVLRRGEQTNLYEFEGQPNCEPFIDRFEHGVAGWTVTFDLRIPNDMTVCDEVLPNPPVCDPVTYTISDSLSNVLYSGSVVSGGTLAQVISNATVTNSLGSTLASIKAEGTAQLADVNNIDSDGSTVPTPAGVAFTCTPAQTVYVGKQLMQTGQTTSYFTNDEGDDPHGRTVDFFTLNGNNVFGNTNRFTDELGGQTYANNIVLDHSTYENDVCLGVYRTIFASDTLVNQIAACRALSVGSFTTGWRLWNATEANNLACLENGFILNYTPLLLGGGTIGYIYTSNTYSLFSCQKAYANASTFYLLPDTVANNSKAIAVRDFTWNGTAFT